MEEDENPAAANSEIRFIALELMKLAQKSGKSFDAVAEEYMENTFKLQMLISGEKELQKPSKKGAMQHEK
jgi:hypothetical protein